MRINLNETEIREFVEVKLVFKYGKVIEKEVQFSHRSFATF